MLNCKAAKQLVKAVPVLTLIILQSCSVTSLFQTDKLDGLQLLADWKADSVSDSKKDTEACRSSYAMGQRAVNSYIEELGNVIDAAVPQQVTKIDLTAQGVASRLNKAVSQFQTTCLKSDGKGVNPDAVGAIADVLLKVSQSQRQQQAEVMKQNLQKYKWANWPGR